MRSPWCSPYCGPDKAGPCTRPLFVCPHVPTSPQPCKAAFADEGLEAPWGEGIGPEPLGGRGPSASQASRDHPSCRSFQKAVLCAFPRAVGVPVSISCNRRDAERHGDFSHVSPECGVCSVSVCVPGTWWRGRDPPAPSADAPTPGRTGARVEKHRLGPDPGFLTETQTQCTRPGDGRCHGDSHPAPRQLQTKGMRVSLRTVTSPPSGLPRPPRLLP